MSGMEVAADRDQSIMSSTNETDYEQSDRPRTNNNPLPFMFFFGFVTCSVLTLYSSYMLTSSDDTKSSSFVVEAVRLWHVIFTVLSLVAILCFAYLQNARVLDEPTVATNSSNNVVLFVFILHSLLCLSTLGVKVYALFRHSKTYDHQTILAKLQYIVICVFCLVQAVFIGHYRHWRCIDWKLRLTLTVIISTNLCMAIGAAFSLADNIDIYTDRNNSFGGIQFCNEIQFNVESASERLNFTLILGFSILAIVLLREMWSVHIAIRTPNLPRVPYRPLEETNVTLAELPRGCSNRITGTCCRIYTLAMQFVCKHAFIESVLICLAMFSVHVASLDPDMFFIDPSCLKCNLSTSTSVNKIESYGTVRSVFYYTVCVIAFIGFLLAVHKKTQRNHYSIHTILLLISGSSQLAIVLYQILDVCISFINDNNDLHNKLFYLSKAIFHVINLFCQTYFILSYADVSEDQAVPFTREVFIRAVCIFLGVVNVERWTRDLCFPPTITEYLFGREHPNDPFGRGVWCKLSQLVTPLATFYRIQSAMMCYGIYKLLKTT